MPQFDYAHRWTDAEIKRLSEKLRYHYRKAARELEKKAKKHLASYSRNLEKMEKLRASGEISAEDFKRWAQREAAIAARDARMIADYTTTANRATEEARRLIAGKAPEVFAECANYAAFGIDKKLGASLRFDLVNRDAVLYMMQRNPKLLPIEGEELLKGATTRWHSQKLTSAVTQGVLRGESVPDVARRLESVTAMDYGASVRAARTALTCAENKGRQHSYERAIAMGIKGQKEWMATLDNRTRDSHRALHGERVDVSERFGNGLEEPGDPSGDPAEVYNCRCTMTFVVDELSDSELEQWDDLPKGTTYEEWKAGKSGR